MQCANGHECPEGITYCPTCGVGVFQAPAAQYVQTPTAQYPVYGAPAAGTSTNGLAIASLVLGIIWLYWLGSVLALIFGLIARKQIKQNNQTGIGMATAGIVLGAVGLVTLLVFVIILIAAVHSSGSNY